MSTPLPGALGLKDAPTPGSGPWRPRAPLPTPRSSLASAVVGGQVFAIGGEDRLAGQVLGTVESFEPSTNLWSTHASLQGARHGLTASMVDGQLFAIGGADAGAGESALVELYNPGTDSWSTRAPLPTARRHAAACAVDGKIYVLGGQLGQAPLPVTRLATVEVYDPASDTWSVRPPMPTARSAAAAAVINGRIFLIGGEPFSKRVEEYDPMTGTWVRRAALPTRRIAPAASALGGQIYVSGGRSPKGDALRVLEVYDPALGVWTSKTPMPAPREALASAAVGGKLYTLGGQFVPGALASSAVEEYDPLTDGTACQLLVPEQLGTVEVLAAGCQSGPGPLPGAICRTLRVTCDGVAPIDVELRISEPPVGTPLRGTVLLGTGGPGLEFHSIQLGGTQFLFDLRAAGFRTVDRAWSSPWFGAGASVRAESCRYATLLTWVEENVHTTGAFGAWGNSGGAAELAFALTTWERADLLDVAVFGGGPPMSRLDLGCLPGDAPGWATVCANLIPAGVIQCAPNLCTVGLSNPVCFGCSSTPSFTDLRSESILHPAALLDFPSTRVDVVIGTQDCSASIFGVLFYNAVESGKTLQFIANTPHQVPQTSAGRAAIVQALLAGA